MFYERGIKLLPSRGIILFLGDIVCVLGAIALAAVVRLRPQDAWVYITHHIPSMTGTCVVFLLIFYIAGLYERQAYMHKRGFYLPLLISVIIGMVTIIVLFYAQFKLHIGRTILLLSTAFIFFSASWWRHLFNIAVGYGFLTKKTLVLGEKKDTGDVIQLLSDTKDAGYKLYGVVSSVKTNPGGFIQGIPILGHTEQLREFAKVYDIETIIVAASLNRELSLLRILRPLRYAGMHILDYASLYEELAQEIPLDHIDDEWLMHAAMNSSRIHIRKIKRLMDITVAIAGLLITLPISLVAALMVRLDSPGPVLFKQIRAGLDGRSYTLFKFRTMKEDAEKESGAVWAEQYDTRVTRIGRFLRKSRIDEIPQLVNVLRGEMSLVGPRPERPEFIETLTEEIPFYKERLLVPPGITGWAQVNYPYAASLEASRRKLQYDLYYIKHMSFFLDTLILLRTFRTIILGLRHSEEALDIEVQEELTILPGIHETTESNADKSA